MSEQYITGLTDWFYSEPVAPNGNLVAEVDTAGHETVTAFEPALPAGTVQVRLGKEWHEIR